MQTQYPKLKDEYSQAQLFDFSYKRPTKYASSEMESILYDHYKHYRLPVVMDSNFDDNCDEWHDLFKARMRELAPYFSGLFDSAEVEVEPLRTVDITTHVEDERDITHTGTQSTHGESSTESDDASSTNGTSKTSGTSSSSSYENGNDVSDAMKRFSDMPQGSVGNLEDLGYLTNLTRDEVGTARNASDISDSETSTSGMTSSNGTGHSEGSLESDQTRTDDLREDNDYQMTQTRKGYEGASASKLLDEYRQTIIDINSRFVEAFADLFLQVYG